MTGTTADESQGHRWETSDLAGRFTSFICLEKWIFRGLRFICHQRLPHGNRFVIFPRKRCCLSEVCFALLSKRWSRLWNFAFLHLCKPRQQLPLNMPLSPFYCDCVRDQLLIHTSPPLLGGNWSFQDGDDLWCPWLQRFWDVSNVHSRIRTVWKVKKDAKSFWRIQHEAAVPGLSSNTDVIFQAYY